MAEKYVTLYFSDNIATEFGTELFFFCKDKLVLINSREEGVSIIRNKLAGEAPTFYRLDRTFSCLIQAVTYAHAVNQVVYPNVRSLSYSSVHIVLFMLESPSST